MYEKSIAELVHSLSKSYSDRYASSGEKAAAIQAFDVLCTEHGYVPDSEIPLTKNLIFDILVADNKCFIQLGFDSWSEYVYRYEAMRTDALWELLLENCLAGSVIVFNELFIFRFLHNIPDEEMHERIWDEPLSPYEYWIKGHYLAGYFREEEALKCFNQAIKRDRNNPLYNKSNIFLLYEMKRYTEAGFHEKTFPVNSDTVNKFTLEVDIANLLRKRKNYKEALEHLDTAFSCLAPAFLRGRYVGRGFADVGESIPLNCRLIVSVTKDALYILDEISAIEAVEQQKGKILKMIGTIASTIEKWEF